MKKIKIPIEVSARHVHLSVKDAKKLFGTGYQLHKKNDISQTGQFATEEILIVKGPKAVFKKVRIVGPERSSSQIELSTTDCVALGISASFHVSGETKKAPKLIVAGPNGKILVPAIVPLRHIHINATQAKKYHLKNRQKVIVRVSGKRALDFKNVVVRIHPTFKFRLHLDTDEGNTAGVKVGDKGEILL